MTRIRPAASTLACALVCTVLLAACSTSTAIVPRQPEAPAPTVPPLTLLDKQETTVLGQSLTYPTKQPAQVTSSIITLVPGQETGPHRHEVPEYAYIESGTLTVEYDGGVVKTYPAGTAFMEAVNTRHNGRNLGSAPVRILVIFIGAQGEQNTVKL